MSIRTGAILLTAMCLCRGFVGSYNNVIALTGAGTNSVMANAFFVHMSLGLITIVLSAIGMLGLYTNSKRIVSIFVPLAFFLVVLVLIDDIISLLEIGMRKKQFVTSCTRANSRHHHSPQREELVLQTCEDHWSTLLWIRLIILLVNMVGNTMYALLVNSVRLDLIEYTNDETVSLPAYQARTEALEFGQPDVMPGSMPSSAAIPSTMTDYVLTPPPAYAPAKTRNTSAA
ncbi:hypothetical protein VKS41_001335 [Umbelopsis sp. WA50703]